MKHLSFLALLAVMQTATAQQATPGTMPQAASTPPAPAGPAQPQRPQLPALPDPFPAALDASMPLSPAQVREVRKRQDQYKKAAAEPIHTPAKPRVRQVTLDLSPGSTPPIVRLAAASGAGVSFLDITGAPWPVAAVENFNKEDFSASLSVPGTNVVTVNASSEYAHGNMIVFLKDMTTPIAMTLLAGQADIDYRLDARVPSRGPNALPEIVPVDISVKFNPRLGDILDGIPPPGVKPVNVNGVAGMAWKDGDQLLIRTMANIMSPKPEQMTSSQDGMRAYQLQYTPQILVSEDGRLVTLRISD